MKGKEAARNFNVVVIGDSQVGKTALILRYIQDRFDNTFDTTLGVNFRRKKLILDNSKVFMQIWDTSGQERFRTIIRSYYSRAMGVVLMYDCTDPKTYQDIKLWMLQIDNHASKDAVKVLVASKYDQQNVQISPEKGQMLADSYEIPFFITSSMTGQNVNEVFNYVAQEIFKRQLDIKLNNKTDIVLHNKKDTKKGNCC